ncbi:hypothetical protein HPB47_001410 [Ixodes persulcatus]|uniref:Uncharacterized protein n=1 Tax=Ixodes persulcatus TaxID=34615 RepID=A0AC60PPF9_IXOPE|nr:hypothetical protein HPB47_001410 [Ixodes persulcatus]
MEEPDRTESSPVGLGSYHDHGSNAAADRLVDGLADLVDPQDVGHEFWKTSEDIATRLKKKLHLGRPPPNGCSVAAATEKLNGVVHWGRSNCDEPALAARSSCHEAPGSSSGCSPSSDCRLGDDVVAPSAVDAWTPSEDGIDYVAYESEKQMPDIMRLFQKDLSEPYSIYTYRYFIHNWPRLCFLAMDGDACVGAIVCKLDVHKKLVKRGYIAMLAVDAKYRKRKIGSTLVLKAIRAMISDDADEVVLETEITNKPALRLYENLGFVRDKRLFRYYLNGVDALRLKLWLL